jgi:hypothetical protein
VSRTTEQRLLGKIQIANPALVERQIVAIAESLERLRSGSIQFGQFTESEAKYVLGRLDSEIKTGHAKM